jgi:hypothetical protein
MKKFAIFKTGKHTDSNGNTKEWTQADLDFIVKTYDPVKHEAPIVIGHPENNAPAYGWIEKLERVGDILYAYPKQVAKEFVEMVKKGMFKKRSISLYPDGSLRHVGFLGAAPPAVKGLPEVEFKEKEARIYEYEFETEEMIFSDKDSGSWEASSTFFSGDSEIIKKYEEAMTIKNEIIKKNEEQISELMNKIKTLENKLKEIAEEEAKKNFSEKIERLIEEGKILPKMKDNIMNLWRLYHQTYNFSENGNSSFTESLLELLKSYPKIISYEEEAKKTEENASISTSSSSIIANEIRKYMRGK